jgi:hypothetical protein
LTVRFLTKKKGDQAFFFYSRVFSFLRSNFLIKKKASRFLLDFLYTLFFFCFIRALFYTKIGNYTQIQKGIKMKKGGKGKKETNKRKEIILFILM